MRGKPEGGVVAFSQADAGWRRLLLPRKMAAAGLENDLAPESQWPLPKPSDPRLSSGYSSPHCPPSCEWLGTHFFFCMLPL